MTPKMPKVGMCAFCRRLLITDVYSLCWNCATRAISVPVQGGMEHLTGDEIAEMYNDVGGES